MKDDIFSVKPDKRRRGSYGTFIALGLMLAVFASVPAEADPRSIEDCEKIQAADAYNQCLASFGPVAHERGVKSDPEGGGGGGPAGGGKAKAASRRHGGHASHGRGYQHQSSRHQSSRHQASGHSKHVDPWAHMRHGGGGGRKRVEFKVRHH